MRSAPSCTVEQIEYERRMSSPPIVFRTVTCWPASNRNAGASSEGTANVSATASRVSRSTFAIRSG